MTRLHVVKQTEWSEDSFGKSVKYFTCIGFILGSILAGLVYLLYFFLPQLGLAVPRHFAAFSLVAAAVLLTGGLHCDGFMDTMDGLFSGRSRQRMLEIMKDSHVGANGVFGFVLLILAKWSLILDQTPENLLLALFLMPVLGRLAMVMGVTFFPYARKEGIGKAFAVFADKRSFSFAFAVALLCVFITALLKGMVVFLALGGVLLFTYFFARYAVKVLGGLTGDVYGAITEIAETIVLCIFAFSV